MKKQLLFYVLIIFYKTIIAQTPPKVFEDWKTTSGTQNFFYKNIVRTDGGDVYVAGATVNGNGNQDILVAKYNSSGTQVWIQQYAGAGNGIDFASDMVVSSSYVYITGAVTNNSITPETDVITMKFNKSDGAVQFVTTYTGSAGLIDAGRSVILDPSTSSVLVTGVCHNSSGDADVVSIRYDDSGVQQWAQIYNYSSGLNDAGFFLRRGASSTFYVFGAVQTSMFGYQSLLLRYSVPTGSLVAVTIGTAVTTSSIEVVMDAHINQTNADTYLTGAFSATGQGTNFYVQKLDGTSLVPAWTYTYDANGLDDVATGIAVDASNNVYVTGYTSHSTTGRNATLIKLNSSGTPVWSQISTLSGNDEANDILMDANDDIYITGYRINQQYGDKNYYTVKYNNSGTKLWEIETDGMSLNDVATNIALDTLNNIVVTGQSETSSDQYNYLTTKYVQQLVTNPVDLYNEPTNPRFGYHQNRGQIQNDTGGVASEVLYYTHHQAPEIYIEKNAFNYVFAKIDTSAIVLDTLERIRLSFVNSNTNIKPYAYGSKTYPLNYFLGHLDYPVTNVVGYDRVVTKNLYPNVDLHYYSNANGFKYYFVVHEGANLKSCKMNIDGAIATFIDNDNLEIQGALGSVTLKQPYAYNFDGTNTTTLAPTYWDDLGNNDYRFSLPSYNTSETLIIVVENLPQAAAPVGSTANLEYSTYYGKADNDIFNDIRVASNGDRYVVGNTNGGSFPVENGVIPYSEGIDAVLLKYSVIKDSLVFATFYGGGGNEFGNSVDVNSIGDIFIGGQTFSSGTFGIPTRTVSNASNQTFNGMALAPSGSSPGDGFIARFSPNGNSLSWARYYGGSQDDGINSIFIDNANNLHFTGFARSSNIAMENAAQPNLSSGNATNNTDAILGKFNSSNALVYSTYLGGGISAFLATKDEGRDITVDGSGNAIVVGTTDASNFPVMNSTGNTNTFYDFTLGGARDGFIARYSPTGTKQFACYFGGADAFGIDEITRVNYNAAKDEIYFAGQSNDTTSFPYVNLAGAFNLKRKATNAAFIASMSGNLTKQWCTNYGKAASNFSVTGLASDNAGIIYLTGQAKSNTLNYPASTPTLTVYQDTIRNADDGFVTIFTPQKNLFHAHYIGGTGNDYINNAYVGTNNKLYVVGNTASSDYPVAYNSVNIQYIDSAFGGGIGNDGFITRFDMSDIQIISVNEISKDDYSLSVYPNPSTNGFVLEMKDDDFKNTQAKVYNITGQLIVEQKITQSRTQFYCESWSSGVYLINVNANGKLKTFKLIKN